MKVLTLICRVCRRECCYCYAPKDWDAGDPYDAARAYRKQSAEQAEEARKWRFRAQAAEEALATIARWPAAGRAQELARETLARQGTP